MESLAVKYRPRDFDSVVSQVSTIKILKRQLEVNDFQNVYLLCGPSGDGKTTIARIFANELNKGHGAPIEIDGASNNGVDNVRDIIKEAETRSLDSQYKVFIVDECHMITTAGWNAFLKCLEEPPRYTIFIFCTTDPQKIPQTILNRCQRFNLTKIATNLIKDRLAYICSQENFTNYDEACDYIAKLSNGGMRDAIAYLEKSASYSTDLKITNVISALGNFSYEVFIELTNSLVDKQEKGAVSIIENFYNQGYDLKVFVEQYLDFILDLNKYCLFKDLSLTKIPLYLEDTKDNKCIKYVVGFDNSLEYFNKLSHMLLELKVALKYDTMPKSTVIVYMLDICRSL